MNEIKAFIRKRKAEEVIDALEAKGFCCMTLIDVMGIGDMADPHKSQLSVGIAERFSNIAKLVVVCSEDDTEKVINIIQNRARSGQAGDGIIYVTPVSQSIHIRSGDTGSNFLQRNSRTN